MISTSCKICGSTKNRLHGKVCNKCDYEQRKKYFEIRNERRKESGYYVGKEKTHDYLKVRKLYNRCLDCGYDEVAEILETHHIDRNRRNHKLNNLALLCPNCHQVRHFKEKTGRYHEKSRTKSRQPDASN